MVSRFSLSFCFFGKFSFLYSFTTALTINEFFSSQVLRIAEKCAATLATVLPPDQIINLASSLSSTEVYPRNMGAIKMLQKVVEHHGREVIEPYLDQVMPNLIKVFISFLQIPASDCAIFFQCDFLKVPYKAYEYYPVQISLMFILPNKTLTLFFQNLCSNFSVLFDIIFYFFFKLSFGLIFLSVNCHLSSFLLFWSTIWRK